MTSRSVLYRYKHDFNMHDESDVVHNGGNNLIAVCVFFSLFLPPPGLSFFLSFISFPSPHPPPRLFFY